MSNACPVRLGRRAAAMLALWALTSATVAAEGGPLRVLLRGYAQPATIQETLQMLSDACRALKGQASTRVPTLPAALLQRTPQLETEDLFDGERWAHYETTAHFVADPASCQPVIWRSFSVTARDGCRRELRGQKGEIMPGDEVPQPSLLDEPRRCSSRPAKPAPDLTGLPLDDAGLGARCVWSADIVARALKQPLGQRTGTDTCVYARRPSVALPGGREDVVLRMRLDTANDRGGDIAALMPIVSELRLAEFSDGSPIAPGRFAREGVEAYLRQPHKQAVGAQR